MATIFTGGVNKLDVNTTRLFLLKQSSLLHYRNYRFHLVYFNYGYIEL